MDKKQSHLCGQRRLLGHDLVAGQADRVVRVREVAKQEEEEAVDVDVDVADDDNDDTVAAATDRPVAGRNVAGRVVEPRRVGVAKDRLHHLQPVGVCGGECRQYFKMTQMRKITPKMSRGLRT